MQFSPEETIMGEIVKNAVGVGTAPNLYIQKKGEGHNKITGLWFNYYEI